jgi:hypothetical protein
MVWMSITAGMLYQEFKQRLCNAYLWDDQTLTGKALVLVSIVFAIGWMLRQMAQKTSKNTNGACWGPFRQTKQ